jgi:hypothetical protein
VIGHVDLLINAGQVREVADGNVVRFEATGEGEPISLGPAGNQAATRG